MDNFWFMCQNTAAPRQTPKWRAVRWHISFGYISPIFSRQMNKLDSLLHYGPYLFCFLRPRMSPIEPDGYRGSRRNDNPPCSRPIIVSLPAQLSLSCTSEGKLSVCEVYWESPSHNGTYRSLFFEFAKADRPPWPKSELRSGDLCWHYSPGRTFLPTNVKRLGVQGQVRYL